MEGEFSRRQRRERAPLAKNPVVPGARNWMGRETWASATVRRSTSTKASTAALGPFARDYSSPPEPRFTPPG